jgi:ferredoxin
VAKSFELTTALQGVDGVISLAKLKTHSFTRFTGGVKNLFGLVHGLKKAEYHMRMRDAESFSGMLVDLAECVKPRLTIMDAVVGMDGDGPSAGRPKQMGLILASPNPHAIDAAALDIVGERPENVPTVRIAVERQLLASDGDERYHISGDRAALKARVEGFRMPPKTRVFGGIPSVLGAFASEGVSRKPVFLAVKCIGCGACEEICPGEALTVDRTAKDVAIDRGMCIRCYCCQEVCPQKAVALRRMPIRSWGRALAGRLGRRSAD